MPNLPSISALITDVLSSAGADIHAAGLHLPTDEREDLRKLVVPAQEPIQADAGNQMTAIRIILYIVGIYLIGIGAFVAVAMFSMGYK